MNILGLDPGLRHCGWAIISVSADRPTQSVPLAGGVIHTDQETVVSAAQTRQDGLSVAGRSSLQTVDAMRLSTLDRRLRTIIKDYPIHVASIETTYVNKNPQTSLHLAQARGVLIAVLGGSMIPIAHYSPRTIKKTVSGHGNANKAWVEKMVRAQLPSLRDMSHDQADAFAIALCHAQHHQWQKAGQADPRGSPVSLSAN